MLKITKKSYQTIYQIATKIKDIVLNNDLSQTDRAHILKKIIKIILKRLLWFLKSRAPKIENAERQEAPTRAPHFPRVTFLNKAKNYRMFKNIAKINPCFFLK